MDPRTKNERLLDDVLAAEAEHGAREASLENLLGLARTRRRIRVARRAGVTAALFLMAAIFGVRILNVGKVQKEISKNQAPVLNFAWITSQPLLATEIVTSQALLLEQMVTSSQAPEIVLTVPGSYREVGDDELLALAAPQVVALVRRGPYEAELVFVSQSSASQGN